MIDSIYVTALIILYLGASAFFTFVFSSNSRIKKIIVDSSTLIFSLVGVASAAIVMSAWAGIAGAGTRLFAMWFGVLTAWSVVKLKDVGGRKN